MSVNPTRLESVPTEDLAVLKDFYLKQLETERPREIYEALGLVVFEEYIRTQQV